MKKIKISILSFALIAFCASCGSTSSEHDAMADTDSAGVNSTTDTMPATNDVGMNPADGGASAAGMHNASNSIDTNNSSATQGSRTGNPDGATGNTNTNTNNTQGGDRR